MKNIFIKIFLWYLRTASWLQLLKTRPKIIALTGSVGKTSLRNAIFATLKDYFRCKKSVKANSETGIPLDILGLHLQNYSFFDWLRVSLLVPVQLIFNWKTYDYYIAELGVDDPLPPKNMGYLLSFIKPNLSIFLNVASVHTQQFEKIIPPEKRFFSETEKQKFLLQAIAKEKGKIITSLGKNKKVVVNFDDPLVLEQARKAKAQLYFFGKEIKGKGKNKIRIVDWQVSKKGTVFGYQYRGEKFSLKTPFLLPEYYGYTFGAALATGLALGRSLKKLLKSLEKNFVLPPGRTSLFKGIKRTLLIDSSYNASRVSSLGALELLERVGKKRKKVFVFGDMRELGSQTEQEHREVSKKILQIVNQLILIGPLTRKYIFPLVKNKIPTFWFSNSWRAADWLKENLKRKEIVLIKGSQNTIFTEIVTEALLADKKDVLKLCRRGKFWDKQRGKVKN